MTKRRLMPMASPSWRRTRAHSAWNVPAWTSRPPSPDQADDPLAELGGGPVGERDREDPPRGDALDADEVRDPVRQDPRLARAGAGQDEQRPVGRGDGAGLLRVQRPDDLGLARGRRAAMIAGSGGGAGGRGRDRRPRSPGRPPRAATRARPGPRCPARRRRRRCVPTVARASSRVGSPRRRREVGLTRPF